MRTGLIQAYVLQSYEYTNRGIHGKLRERGVHVYHLRIPQLLVDLLQQVLCKLSRYLLNSLTLQVVEVSSPAGSQGCLIRSKSW